MSQQLLVDEQLEYIRVFVSFLASHGAFIPSPCLRPQPDLVRKNLPLNYACGFANSGGWSGFRDSATNVLAWPSVPATNVDAI